MNFPVDEIRKDFPILDQKVNGRPLVYFDNAATTQKPMAVINRISEYYLKENSNVHRGVHHLSQLATEAYENARESVRKFINAGSKSEIIFTRGTTESINMLATIVESRVNEGDEILVTAMEHHSNFVPWQQLCLRKRANLKIVPISQQGVLDMDFLKKALNPRVKFLAVTHISNVLGTINPVKEIVKLAHEKGIPVVIDGAQGIVHSKVDVQDIDADFYAFSGHKIYGPMGIGVLYGRESWLNSLPPYQFGGEMVEKVGFDMTTFNHLPYKYEAGTPNVAGALGLEAALHYIDNLGMDKIIEHEDYLLKIATKKLSEIEGMKFVGEAPDKTAALSFLVEGIHPYDLGTLLDQMGVAVRTGHHCADPLMDFYGVPGTVRASFGLYNTEEEVSKLVDAAKKAVQMLR
ncbi:MAG: cysteine desulfurase [Bacteroidales bacterium]|nr:cysteine desulfurase [Bacteroidales bacterium]